MSFYLRHNPVCAGALPVAVVVYFAHASALWARTGAVAGGARPGPDTRALPELADVDVNEKLGASIPLDAELLESRGSRFRLRDIVKRGGPVILTFNYSDCPLLCSVQLSGLVKALSAMELVPGQHFQLVTIGLDPGEKLAQAQATKLRYLERYAAGRRGRGLDVVPEETLERGWKFLIGEQRTVKAIADAVGFGYVRAAKKQQYLHPSVFMILAPDGTVAEYVYGVSFESAALDAKLTMAGLGIRSPAVERFMYSCYLYEPSEGFDVYRAMQIVGSLFALALLVTIGGLHLRKLRRLSKKECHS